MGRLNMFTDEELLEILAKIEVEYGFLGIETLQKAHKEKPFEYPSYKMFERRLGGFKYFNSPQYRATIQPYLDKLKKK